MSEAVFHNKDVLAVLQRQMTMTLSQDVFFKSRDVPKLIRHSAAALHGRGMKEEVQERVLRLARRGVCCNSENGDLTRSIAHLIQIYLNKTATSLKFNGPAAYPAQVLWLNITKRRERYRTDHGHLLLGFLTVEDAEFSEENGEQDVDRSVCMHKFASSEVVPLINATAQTCRTSERDDRTRLFGRAKTSLLKPRKEDAERGFGVETKDGEICSWLPLMISYCCDTS